MAEVLAGLVCGYALALVSTPLIALALLRLRSSVALIGRVVPREVPLAAVAVVVHGFAFLTWTALGIVLGLLLGGIEDRAPEGGLGSPNGLFTFILLVWTVVAAAPIMVLLPRLRRPAAAMAILFVALFGWLMPYLAEWSPINS
jgi:hypothetical protein